MAPRKHKSRNKKAAGPSNPPSNDEIAAPKEPRATITINVDADTVESIKSLRTRLGELGGNGMCNQTYFMPTAPPNLEDSDVIHLNLAGNDGIAMSTLKLRFHDLYAGGFANQDGKWFQLHRHKPSIPDSVIISLGDRYSDLKSTASCIHLSDILCKGQRHVTLRNAMTILAKTTVANMNSQLKKIAESLLIVILNCCEATRLNSILSYPPPSLSAAMIDRWGDWSDPFTDANPDWVDKLVQNWGNMSDVVKKRNRGQDLDVLDGQMVRYGLYVPTLRNGRVVASHLATAEDAENELGIINWGSGGG